MVTDWTFTRPVLQGLLLAALLLPAPRSLAATLTGLGDLPGGAFHSQAYAVSGDGSTVVGTSEDAPSNNRDAFVWTTQHGMVAMGLALAIPGGGVQSFAFAVSADGSTAAGRDLGDPAFPFPRSELGFRWSSDGPGIPTGFIEPIQSTIPNSSGNDCGALGVSDDGLAVVGFARGEFGREAFVQTYDEFGFGTMQGLGDLAGGTDFSVAYDASADGSTVVGFGNSATGTEAFVWTSGTGMLAIGFGTAVDITPDGSTVVGSNSAEGFLWTSSSGMVGLGTLPGETLQSRALGVSADGSTVVGYASSAGLPGDAIIWDATNGMRRLQTVLTGFGVDLSGWTLTSATGISDDGNIIVGYGTNPNGFTEGWIVDLVPEPSATLIQGVALAALMGMAARRQAN